MSGIEIAGIVLGSFPLLISALEHWEDTKKVSKTWWKIKRAHRKDLGRVKDCQLKFRLNLKELLLPLVLDGVVDSGEYERLVASPGGQGWKEEAVEEALRERLAESHERYVETLQEMVETLAQLSKECRVDDSDFQVGLKSKNEEASTGSQNQQAQASLIWKANVVFQAKRIKYSVTSSRREELLSELDRGNNRLQDVLAANDRVAAITGGRTPALRQPNSKILTFWRHARSIFTLLDHVWTCACKSHVGLRLHHQSLPEIAMKMHLRLCHGKTSMQWRLADVPSALQLGGSGTKSNLPSITIHGSSSTITKSRSHNSSTILLTSQTSCVHADTGTATSLNSSTALNKLESEGLCQTCSAINSQQDPSLCLGQLSDGEHEYALFPAVEHVPDDTAITLLDLLKPDHKTSLSRVQRYSIALTLASSHLQLHSTPWLTKSWTSADVRFPTRVDNGNNCLVLHGEPYILADFGSNTVAPSTSRKDRSFSTLGIVLLELCFGQCLENHSLWSNPVYAPGISDPIMRHTVAVEWLDEVQGEAGEDFARAVSWTLREAPAVVKDDKWRAVFAQNVVQPLQFCLQSLNPRK